MKIKAEDFFTAIGAELEDYAGEITEATKEVVQEVGRECKKDIQDKAPVRFGKYKKSWKVKTAYNGKNGIRVVVHAVKYQLTHLLENGHAMAKGGRVEGIPHIAPAARKVNRELPEKLKKAIGEIE